MRLPVPGRGFRGAGWELGGLAVPTSDPAWGGGWEGPGDTTGGPGRESPGPLGWPWLTGHLSSGPSSLADKV